MEKTKLELEINKPVLVKKMYDDPIIGESQYGKYYLYTFMGTDKKLYSFFANDIVHEKLKTFAKNEAIELIKLAAVRGKATVTEIAISKYNGSNGKALPAKKAEKSSPPESPPDNDNTNDSMFQLMVKSLQDSIQMQKLLDSKIDIERIGITLFIARSKGVSAL